MRPAVFALIGAVALAACAKSEPPGPVDPAPAAPPAPVAPPSLEPSPPVPPAALATSEPGGVHDVATEEDFEDESAKNVTGDNLDAQLDALEKEILAE